MGKRRVGQHGTMAEDLVEDVGLLQVVELIPAADEGGHRKLAIRQQGKEAIKRDEGGHRGHRPAGGRDQGGVDLIELRNAIPGQREPCQPRPVFITGLAFQGRELALDEYLPGAVLLVRVVDPALFIRLMRRVETCHECFHPLGAAPPSGC